VIFGTPTSRTSLFEELRRSRLAKGTLSLRKLRPRGVDFRFQPPQPFRALFERERRIGGDGVDLAAQLAGQRPGTAGAGGRGTVLIEMLRCREQGRLLRVQSFLDNSM